MADVYHMLHYDSTDQYWKCRTGACSAKFHDEDVVKAGYSNNHDFTLYVNEEDFTDALNDAYNATIEEPICTCGETKISDGIDSTTPSALSILTSLDGGE